LYNFKIKKRIHFLKNNYYLFSQCENGFLGYAIMFLFGACNNKLFSLPLETQYTHSKVFKLCFYDPSPHGSTLRLFKKVIEHIECGTFCLSSNNCRRDLSIFMLGNQYTNYSGLPSVRNIHHVETTTTCNLYVKLLFDNYQ
jgi:hypothetical protein